MSDIPVKGAPVVELTVPAVSPQQLPEPLAARLSARMDRLGYLGAFFAYAAHQPDALAGFIDYTESLKKALPSDLAEIVALSVARMLRNAYELPQHERLSAKLGFDEDWIAAARDGLPDVLDARQAAVRDLTAAVLTDAGHGARSTFERVVKLVGPTDAIGVLLHIGRYVAHAHIANALELTDPTGGKQ